MRTAHVRTDLYERLMNIPAVFVDSSVAMDRGEALAKVFESLRCRPIGTL